MCLCGFLAAQSRVGEYAILDVCASGPIVSSVRDSGNTPSIGKCPVEDLYPTTPLKLAGTRTEPPVSVPMASGVRPAATTAPEPDDEPPGERAMSGSRGLRGVPKCGLRPMPE